MGLRLFDGSSMYAQFKDDSDRLSIQTLISDADMMFVGNDGGSEVTVLTLDMSDAGTGIFNHDVRVGDNSFFIGGAGDDTTICLAMALMEQYKQVMVIFLLIVQIQ